MKSTVSMEDRTVEKYFDNNYFRDCYPLRKLASRQSNIAYYKKKGWKLGQRPVPWFDPQYYVDCSPDVATAGIEPFEHYLKFGSLEGRLPLSKDELLEIHKEAILEFIPYEEAFLEKIAGHFDSGYYVEQFPKCATNNCDPILHYLSFGWKMGLKPNRWFDENFYRKSFTDIADQPHSTFIHFLNVGAKEGRAANANYFEQEPAIEVPYDTQALAIQHYFDEDFYKENFDPDEPLLYDPLVHYLKVGWRDAKNPNDWFDVTYYVGRYSDVAAANVEPLYHFLRWGALEGRSPNPENEFPDSILRQDKVVVDLVATEFDEEHYRQQKGVPQEEGLSLVEHYLQHGEQMGLSPTSWFDAGLYADKYLWGNRPDQSAFYHYLYVGRDIGYAPFRPRVALRPLELAELGELYKSDFDEEFYGSVHADLAKSGVNMLDHFRLFGEREGRKPREDFDPSFYRSENMVHSDTEGRPFEHYLRFGKAAGLRTHDGAVRSVNLNARVPNSVILRNFFAESAAKTIVDHDTDPHSLRIHFVVPDFAKGSGGHMTIFRTMKWLEMFGHKLTLWILNPDRHTSEALARQDIHQYFQPLKADVRFLNNEFYSTQGDVVFATAWQTAAVVNQASGFKEKFYFVQDHEPEFYPTGTDAILSRETYSWGLNCICASPWLRQLMESYGCWARHFWLAYDQSRYFAPKERPQNEIPQIAVYARHFTARRAVELTMAALQELALDGVEFHAHLFGADYDVESCPFPATSHGVLSEHELADLYRKCDIGICFSATNYSLVPQEMMGTGLPVIELNSECSKVVYPDEAALKVGPDPAGIMGGIRKLIEDKGLREKLALAGKTWAEQFSWEESSRLVEQAILEKMQLTRQHSQVESSDVASPAILSGPKKATVIIPTYNGGEQLYAVAEMLEMQKTPWEYDVLIMDSTSPDGSYEILQEKHPSFRYHQIPQSEFSHGGTRNRAIEKAGSEFVCLLTQDALPADEYWLYNLVSVTEAYPNSAGGFGRHKAYNDASPFTKRDLSNFFKSLDDGPVAYNRNWNKALWNIQDRQYVQKLHYFSDNSSCLRRKIWEDIPYPEIEYGEDQAWALSIINAGYDKVYARSSLVYHSHDYDVEENYKRAKTEAKFFREVFGYKLLTSEDTLFQSLKNRNANDSKWGAENNVAQEEIDFRLLLNESHLRGWLDGTLEVD